MPLIPLLRAAQVAPAPRVVIDREKRPTKDTSGIQRGVALVGRTAQQPLLPEGYGQASARALGAVGGAIAQGGDILGALAIKRREAESDVQIAEADKQMDLEMADFETWRRDNPDPQTWDAEWSQRMAGARERIAGAENLHPGAREQINLRLTRWEGQSASFVSRTASRETFTQARSGFLARIDNSIANQSEDSFHADLQSAEAKGYIYPHEAEALRQQFSRTGERMQKEAQAEEERLQFEGDAADAIRDPRVWLEENKSPWKGDEIRWQKIKNIADAREREGTAEIVNQVNDLIASGAVKTIAEIDAIESPFFTPALRDQAKRHLASRDQFAEAMERETNGVRNAVEMRKRVKSYDPSRDPDRTKYFELVREIGSTVEQSMAGELTGELYKKYGTQPPQLKVRPELQRNVSSQLDVLFDARTGAIPYERRVTVKEDGKKKEKWETDPAAKRRAIDAQTTIEIKMADWFKEHPDATLNDAKKKLNDFLPEGTRAGVLDALQKRMKPQAAAGGFEATATAYWPGPKDDARRVGLSGTMEGGTLDRFGKPIWGRTTMEDFMEGKGDYVTVAMDGSYANGQFLRSPDFPGVPFRVADTGDAFTGKGTSRVDIAFRDPEKAKSFKKKIRFEPI